MFGEQEQSKTLSNRRWGADNMDLVSVIIPIYQVEDYLQRCVASVAGQSYQNLEMILVDDGSTDGCPEICDQWAQKDSRIIVVHQKNLGLSAARNTGLSLATGDYVLMVDSDDYVAPFAVEHLLRCAQKTDADMVICDYIKGCEENYIFSEKEQCLPKIIDPESALLNIYTAGDQSLRFTAAWMKLYRKSLFEGIRYPQGKLFEDIYTTHKIIYAGRKIAVLDEALYYYYQRENSIMNTSFHLKKLDYLQALAERVAFFSEHGRNKLEQLAYDELLHCLIWEYSRTRDVLHSFQGMEYVKKLYRTVYTKGYASKRYPKENQMFLAAFYHNPEWIIWYWRITGKISEIFKRR